jgi:hypothetical protein
MRGTCEHAHRMALNTIRISTEGFMGISPFSILVPQFDTMYQTV